MGLEAPYVGNPPDNDVPEDWLDDDEVKALKATIEFLTGIYDELEGRVPENIPEVQQIIEQAERAAAKADDLLSSCPHDGNRERFYDD